MCFCLFISLKMEGELPPKCVQEANVLTVPRVTHEDSGTYVCTASNKQGKVEAFTRLQVHGECVTCSAAWWVTGVFGSHFTWAFSERVMPYFAQEPLSYLTLPTIKNAYKAFNIKINFRPDNVDGKSLINVLFSYFCFWYFIECNLSGSSVPPLSPTPHPCGGKVSYCMLVSLGKWKLMLAELLSVCIRLLQCPQSWFMGCERNVQKLCMSNVFSCVHKSTKDITPPDRAAWL